MGEAVTVDVGADAKGKDQKEEKRVGLFDEAKTVETWRTVTAGFLDGIACTTFMTIVTIWALFGDDLRLIVTDYEADDTFTAITIFCLVCFSIELLVASVTKDGYFLSFYFTLDLIATGSLLFDIPKIYEEITGIEEKDSTATPDGSDQADSAQVKETATLTRAGRTSKAGARAGRIFRLVRLVRILKLYKQYIQHQDLTAKQIQEMEEEELAQSRVGQKLSDLTTRRVIIGVLTMLLLLPLFDYSYHQEDITLMDGGLEMVVSTYNVPGANSTAAFQAALEAYVKNTDGLYWIVVNGTDYSGQFGFDGSAHRRLRSLEYDEIVFEGSYAKFDLHEDSVLQAWLNIARTLFICLILGLGAMLFSRDANILVLSPIERMIKKVKDMAENPLKKQEIRDDDGDQQFETKILENAFSKICSLMAVGFGEAGAEIIGENMRSGGELNPMVPGKKMVAIFGFCDIRQFTDATEILQEGVMEFVNSIAHIVHMEVSLHGGSANKNIGDAFLLVWKFDKDIEKEEILEAARTGVTKGSKGERINKVADGALASFVVMIAMLKKSARLRAYGKNEALCKRMPNYSVKMGFGLHVGWAIEGAIGSEYKVDASYLSPNVNMSARLEAATKQFGVPILLTEDLVNICSESTKARCRAIDRVTVKGSSVPMTLLTYDVDTDGLDYDLDSPEFAKDPDFFTKSHGNYKDEFAQHPDIVKTRGASPEFLKKFGEGYDAYRRGDWAEAREILLSCDSYRRSAKGAVIRDGPSQTLLRVMEELDFKAPADWPGYRELTEK
mmetsp:Transcript_31759/g.38366  ORF Transcript_31759/g.38366 Transcript_31759/m.38366 type:complete len:784 (-) Transcript_31759:812-3163(-)|eukprot:CAMPEP_0197857420 /NCGR_PEP_ID=MMETSP1438-20131217/30446_1 /TAXON_ID=1461541 /ORGANISM="Pterosperma sp., Strain CCMP1384" /LENGTH=783 /DNA_ID=CAMNT_0043473239 /DNA_START=326 /DNA_END=2677 /DNA_ORIENTATION=+